MTYTSAQAAKLLATREENAKTFLAIVGEDAESVRPSYSYAETKAQPAAPEAKIRRVKHATTVIPAFGMTVGEMLVRIPQLSQKTDRLDRGKPWIEPKNCTF